MSLPVHERARDSVERQQGRLDLEAAIARLRLGQAGGRDRRAGEDDSWQ
jgi:hypothetical protein